MNLDGIAQQVFRPPQRVAEDILRYVEETIEEARKKCPASSAKFMDETGAFGKMRSSY